MVEDGLLLPAAEVEVEEEAFPVAFDGFAVELGPGVVAFRFAADAEDVGGGGEAAELETGFLEGEALRAGDAEVDFVAGVPALGTLIGMFFVFVFCLINNM